MLDDRVSVAYEFIFDSDVAQILCLSEIAFCSSCGKQVLTSRYSWSDSEVICNACSEKEPEAYLSLGQEPFSNSVTTKLPLNTS